MGYNLVTIIHTYVEECASTDLSFNDVYNTLILLFACTLIRNQNMCLK